MDKNCYFYNNVFHSSKYCIDAPKIILGLTDLNYIIFLNCFKEIFPHRWLQVDNGKLYIRDQGLKRDVFNCSITRRIIQKIKYNQNSTKIIVIIV